MSWVILALIIVAIFAFVLINLLQKQGMKSTEFPYNKQDVLFSPAERSFLGVLNQAVGSDAQVFGKVRVADVITPMKGMSRSNWQKAFNKTSGKHFDFILCNKDDLSVLCAIELNDSSHNSNKRKERDDFLKGACQSANLPLIQVSAKATYNIKEIQQSVAAYLPDIGSQKIECGSIVPSADQQLQQETDKTCPKCSSAMVRKTATKGKNIGSKFWACSSFPKCRHIEAIDA